MILVPLALAAELPPCSAPEERTAFLLTMVPGGTIPTTFGHTALLVYDPKTGQESPVYDHGHYDSKDPWFAVDYALQRAEYWGKVRSLSRVRGLYKYWKRDIVAQRLRLTDEELDALVADQLALTTEGNTFRYQWYERNCTTRVRDSLDGVLGGHLQVALAGPTDHTVRDQVLAHASGTPLLPVLSWGTGSLASTPLTAWQAAFLPDALMEGLADVQRPDGQELVSQTCRLVKAGGGFAPRTAPPLGRAFGQVGVGVAAAVGLLGFVPGLGRALVALFGLALVGIAGIDLFGYAVGAGSPWWSNHGQAYANPLALALVLQALGWRRARPFTWLVVGVATLGALLAMVRGFPNHDAHMVALVLPGLWASAAHLERLARRQAA
ncbi:MAG: DUF4105 domain-containing protein [Alphaproteobacteria bacterium]|nr:DUF4105 domain-containing protein [Alphaproteobacteria bacterium]